MTDPPVRLCCGTRHYGPLCPDGSVMCCMCFDRFSIEELWIDKNGNREDVCRSCGAAEQAVTSIDGSVRCHVCDSGPLDMNTANHVCVEQNEPSIDGSMPEDWLREQRDEEARRRMAPLTDSDAASNDGSTP